SNKAADTSTSTSTSALTASGDPSTVTLLPVCVTQTAPNEFWATFGYDSAASLPVVVPTGSTNGFKPGPADHGQPTRFDPGKHPSALRIQLDGKSSLTWTLGQKNVTATTSSPTCAATTRPTAPVLAEFALYAQASIRLDHARLIGGDVGVASSGLQ